MNEVLSAKEPINALRTNTEGTLRLLEAAIAAGVKKFIYFSTAHVYGTPLEGDIHEQTVPRPAHPYAWTHKAAEGFLLDAHDRGKITVVILRMSNSIGAHEHSGLIGPDA